ncbi:MAG TPA: hypothetical protein VFS00_01105 [Polyangiaceae bacterium]|nr:hypothetical protein [Polyangiaceae bacterium]
MSLWDHLFDSDWKQRSDIETTREQLDLAVGANDALREIVLWQGQRLDRLELLFETLFRGFEKSGVVDRASFARMVEQVDLADGLLDGKLGPDQAAHAPRCGRCGRPASPLRPACIYCGQPAQFR